MKNTLLGLLLWLCLWPLHADQDILVNSNFADGRAHWKGDAQDPDAGDVATLGEPSSGDSGGSAIIKLNSDKWTKLYQVFVPREKKLFYTITFQLSGDYKLPSQNNSDTSMADFGDVDAINAQWTLPEQYWSLIVTGGMTPQLALQPDLSKKNKKQTLSGRLTDLSPGLESVFLIAFPPGNGTVTFYTVALSKDDPNAQP